MTREETSSKRPRRQNPSSITVSTMKVSLLLLCTKFGHSFTIAPSGISTTTTASAKISRTTPPSATRTILLFNAKDGDEKEKIEWDGVVVEGAHDAEFESFDEDDAFVPSADFMAVANSVPSTAMAAAFDPMKNCGQIHTNERRMTEDDILDMGGDPSFWDGPEDDAAAAGGDEGFRETDDAAFFGGWDGQVIEDAHLD